MAKVRPQAVALPVPSARQIHRNDFKDLNDALAGATRFTAQTLDVAVAADNLKAEIKRNPDVKADNQAKVDNAANAVKVLKQRRELVQQQFVSEELKRKHDVLADLQESDSDTLMSTGNDAAVVDTLNSTYFLDPAVRKNMAESSGRRAAAHDYKAGIEAKIKWREERDEDGPNKGRLTNAGQKFDWKGFVEDSVKKRADGAQTGMLPPKWARAYQEHLLALATVNARSEALAITRGRATTILGRAEDSVNEGIALVAKGESSGQKARANSLELAQLLGYLGNGDDADPEQMLKITELEKAAWLLAIDQIIGSSTDVAGPLTLLNNFLFGASKEVQAAIGKKVAKSIEDWQASLNNASNVNEAAHAMRVIDTADSILTIHAAKGLVEALRPGQEREDAMAAWIITDRKIQKREFLVNEISMRMGDLPFPESGVISRSSPTADEERDAVNEWVRRNHLKPGPGTRPLTLKQAVIKLVSAGYPMGDIAVEKLTAAINDPFQIDKGYLFAADIMKGIADATSMNTAVGVMQGLGPNGTILEGFVRATARLGDDDKLRMAMGLADALIREGRDDAQDNRATARRKVRGSIDEATGKTIDKPVVMGAIMDNALQSILESMTPPGEVVPEGFSIADDLSIIDFEYNSDFREAFNQLTEFHYFTSTFGNEEDRLRNAVDFAVNIVIQEWSGQIVDGELRIIPRVMDIGPLAGANPEAVVGKAKTGRTGFDTDESFFAAPARDEDGRPPPKTYAGRYYHQSTIGWRVAKGLIGPEAELDTRRSIQTSDVPGHFGKNAKDPRAGVQMIFNRSVPVGYMVWDKAGNGQLTVYLNENIPMGDFVTDVVAIRPVTRATISKMALQVARKYGKSYRLGAGLDKPKDFPARTVQSAARIMGPKVDLYGKFERAAFKLFASAYQRPPNQTGDQVIIDGYIEQMAKYHGWEAVSDPPLSHGGDMSDEHPQSSASLGGPGSIATSRTSPGDLHGRGEPEITPHTPHSTGPGGRAGPRSR